MTSAWAYQLPASKFRADEFFLYASGTTLTLPFAGGDHESQYKTSWYQSIDLICYIYTFFCLYSNACVVQNFSPRIV